MFTVKKATTVECYCPHGHTLIPDPETDHSMNFCTSCGLPVEKRQVTYDAAYCAFCHNRVNPSWNYCPYCGREGNRR